MCTCWQLVWCCATQWGVSVWCCVVEWVIFTHSSLAVCEYGGSWCIVTQCSGMCRYAAEFSSEFVLYQSSFATCVHVGSLCSVAPHSGMCRYCGACSNELHLTTPHLQFVNMVAACVLYRNAVGCVGMLQSVHKLPPCSQTAHEELLNITH